MRDALSTSSTSSGTFGTRSGPVPRSPRNRRRRRRPSRLPAAQTGITGCEFLRLSMACRTISSIVLRLNNSVTAWLESPLAILYMTGSMSPRASICKKGLSSAVRFLLTRKKVTGCCWSTSLVLIKSVQGLLLSVRGKECVPNCLLRHPLTVLLGNKIIWPEARSSKMDNVISFPARTQPRREIVFPKWGRG